MSRFFNFFNIRAVIALTCVIIALSLVSLGIAVNITVTMIEKRDNIVSSKKEEVNPVSQNAKKPVNVLNPEKAKKLGIFYNGIYREDMLSYSGEGGETVLPLDQLLGEWKTGYKVINSDDTFIADTPGKQLRIKLGSGDGSYGTGAFTLGTASFAYNKHIYVSSEILNWFKEYIFDITVGSDRLYLYCRSRSLGKEYENLRLLKQTDGGVRLYSLSGKTSAMISWKEIPGFRGLYPLSGSSNFLLDAGSSYYLLGKSFKPQLLHTGSNARLSGSHGQIYWTDEKRKRLYIYDIRSGRTGQYKDYFLSLPKKDPALARYDSLYDFSQGSNYARFDLLGDSTGDIYTILLRKGKVIAEGQSHYSPDGRKLVYHSNGYTNDKGFYIVNTDGTGTVALSDGVAAAWVDNATAAVTSVGGIQLFNSAGIRMGVGKAGFPAFAGTAADGDVFTVSGGFLYVQRDGKNQKLFRLPWSLDSIFAVSGKGPYLAMSMEKKSIYCFSGNSSLLAADTDKFINIPGNMNPGELFSANSAVSPKGDRMSFLQNEGGVLQLNVVDMENMKMQSIAVDSSFGTQTRGRLELRWLDGTRILLHSGNRGWVVDMTKGVEIFPWTEPEDGVIRMVYGSVK